MGLTAVAVYLRVLRDGRGLTQAQAAVRAGIAPKTLERWEGGKNEPTISNLRSLVRVLRGSVDDAIYLLVRDEVTEADGREAAEAWLNLSDEEQSRVDSILTATPSDELDVLLKDLQAEIRDDETRKGVLRLLIDSWRGGAR